MVETSSLIGTLLKILQDGAERVKKLIVLLSVAGMAGVAGCHSGGSTGAPSPVLRGNQTGASNPEAAIKGFLDAAKAQDLQAMGAIWGGPDGPARDLMDRNEIEKRELVMMCYLKHDSYDVVVNAPNPGGGQAFVVSLAYKDIKRSTTVQVVQGPSARWYVKDVDVLKLNDICARRG